jgi:hypothetical protein
MRVGELEVHTWTVKKLMNPGRPRRGHAGDAPCVLLDESSGASWLERRTVGALRSTDRVELFRGCA